MTVRNRFHSRITATISYFIEHWNRQQKAIRGEVASGEAGFRLTRKPDTTVGVDVAYVSWDVARMEVDDTTLYDGPPLLAVEILSPNDTLQETNEKIRKYLEAGTKLVWVIDPQYPTVMVHESGKLPVLYNRDQVVSADPYLPGFKLPVAELLP